MTMLTYSPSRRERKKRETRERIITTALELFGRKGIENTTVDEIAAAADIGKGTIYNYFRTNKDKRFTMIRPLIETSRGVSYQVGASANFEPVAQLAGTSSTVDEGVTWAGLTWAKVFDNSVIPGRRLRSVSSPR